jgi:hypothetical protein
VQPLFFVQTLPGTFEKYKPEGIYTISMRRLEMVKAMARGLVFALMLLAATSPAGADSCQPVAWDPRNPGAWDALGIQEGQAAVSFSLLDTAGSTVSLSSLWANKPLFLEFGAYT